jgi:uncharacterized protein (UPF0332 family)
MSEFLTKFRRAARSAILLLGDGDPEGAVNRAYFCMFSAARAALSAMNARLNEAKTHRTIVSRFASHVVKPGHIEVKFGRLLTRAMRSRKLADYEATDASALEAAAIVDEMREFLAAIEHFLASRAP